MGFSRRSSGLTPGRLPATPSKTQSGAVPVLGVAEPLLDPERRGGAGGRGVLRRAAAARGGRRPAVADGAGGGRRRPRRRTHWPIDDGAGVREGLQRDRGGGCDARGGAGRGSHVRPRRDSSRTRSTEGSVTEVNGREGAWRVRLDRAPEGVAAASTELVAFGRPLRCGCRPSAAGGGQDGPAGSGGSDRCAKAPRAGFRAEQSDVAPEHASETGAAGAARPEGCAPRGGPRRSRRRAASVSAAASPSHLHVQPGRFTGRR